MARLRIRRRRWAFVFIHGVVVLGWFLFSHAAEAVGNYPGAPFCIPTTGTVTNIFTTSHPAIDIAKGSGKGPAVYAPYPGEIIYVGWSSGEDSHPDIYPKHLIIINHGLVNGSYVASMFAHMGANGDPSRGVRPVSYIPEGILNGSVRQVSMGTLIGYQGTAGDASGTHTHFALRVKVSSTPFNSYASFWTTGNFTDPGNFIVGSTLLRGTYLESNCSACPFAVGQGSSRQHLFQEAYERNGGKNNLGCPTSAVWRWHDMERQDFEGAVYWKPSALLEVAENGSAYFVHGSIGEEYLWRRPDIGPPVSDEYTNAFGARQSDFRKAFIYWNGAIRSPLNYLIRGSGPAIFFMERGVKRWVPNQTTLSEMYPAASISVISDSELNNVFSVNGPSIPNVEEQWLAQYFDNPNFRRPARAFALTTEENLSFDWGYNSPASLVPQDHFSASFSRRLFFRGGTYEFTLAVDDDVRVYLDGQIIGSQGLGVGSFQHRISEGYHLLRVDYREYCAPAYLNFSFRWLDTTPPTTSISLNPAVPDGENGWYRHPVAVSLSASDEDSRILVIEYDLGSGWVTYAAPFTIEQEGVINLLFRAIDSAGNVEPSKSVIMRIDATPPSSELGGVGLYYNKLPITLFVTTSDNNGLSRVSLYKRLAGAEKWLHHWTSPSGTVPTQFKIHTLGEGRWEFASRAVDLAGNVEVLPTEADVSLIFDKTAPITVLLYEGPVYECGEGGFFISAETYIKLSAYDNSLANPFIETSGVSETEYRYYTALYDSGKQVYMGPFSLDGEDGVYVINYNSVDAAGNAEPVRVREVYLDSTPPVSFDDSDGKWRNRDVAVLIVSSDGEGSGVKAIFYRGAQEGMVEGNRVVVVFETEGIHELYYYAVDNVGNVEGIKHATLVRIDKTPPVIAGLPDRAPNEYGWYNEDVAVRFVATDQPGLSGVVEDSVTPDITISTEGVGQEVTGYAADVSGNNASVTIGGINIDKTDPQTAATIIPDKPDGDNGWYRSDVIVVLNAADATSGVRRTNVEIVEDGIVSSQSYFEDITLSFTQDGVYDINFYSEDFAGNVEEPQSVGIKRDATPPVISGNPGRAPNEHGWYNDDVIIRFEASDATSGVRMVTEDQLFSLEGANQSIVGVATDFAGNSSAVIISGINIDKTSPVTSVELSGLTGLAAWYVSPVVLQLFANDSKPGIGVSGVSHILYTIGNSEIRVYSSELIFEDGEYVFEFWSIDRAGNEEAHRTLSFKIDTLAPAAPTSSIPGGSFTDGETVVTSLFAEEGAEIYYALNGGMFLRYADQIVITEDTTLYTYAVDEAGNRSATVVFTYTFNPPSLISSEVDGESPQVLGARTEEGRSVFDGGEVAKGAAIGLSDVFASESSRGSGNANPSSGVLGYVWLLLAAASVVGGTFWFLWWRRAFPR